MASHCLTQDGLGKDSRFLSINLYFVADMFFLKLMEAYMFLEKKKYNTATKGNLELLLHR